MASTQILEKPQAAEEAVIDDPPNLKNRHEIVHVSDEDEEQSNLWWRTYKEPQKPIAQYSPREVGIQGEALACRYLMRNGMEILDQNWRTSQGEVDIIALDKNGETVLVEVKTRLCLDPHSTALPELAVDHEKQQRYRRLALIYLMLHSNVQVLRFDVVAITIQAEHLARLRHLMGAFSWDN